MKKQVFLSWSKDLSKEVATLLHDWLPFVVPNLTPWISTEDIGRGEQWFVKINDAINDSVTGIICITKENRNQPWLLFESGALQKGIGKPKLMTLLIDLENSDLYESPFHSFNHTKPTEDSMLQLVMTLYSLTDPDRDKLYIKGMFDAFWPKFGQPVQAIIEKHKVTTTTTTIRVDLDPMQVQIENLSKNIVALDRNLTTFINTKPEIQNEVVYNAISRGTVNNRIPVVPTKLVVEAIESYMAKYEMSVEDLKSVQLDDILNIVRNALPQFKVPAWRVHSVLENMDVL